MTRRVLEVHLAVGDIGRGLLGLLGEYGDANKAESTSDPLVGTVEPQGVDGAGGVGDRTGSKRGSVNLPLPCFFLITFFRPLCVLGRRGSG